MNKVYLNPSLYAHIFNGLLLLLAFIVLYNNYSKVIQLEPYKLLSLILFSSIAIGIHGLSHLGLEKGYGYNPISMII